MQPSHKVLKRELGVLGATMMGLGSIVGTGVFVSIGIAAGAAGPSVILSIALAAVLATCNAFSSAQLAASHAVSGGTYEYGYRYLHPWLGFTAGWMFLCAKTASAATAALGFSGYLLHLLGLNSTFIIPIAIIVTSLLTVLVLSGLKRSNWVNILIVSLTLLALLAFVLFGLPNLYRYGKVNLLPFFPQQKGMSGFFYATALMFVAYTGYARIATLGEEIKNPQKAIPKAILITLAVSAILYISVSIIAVGSVGAEHLAKATQSRATPLEIAASAFHAGYGLSKLVALGACTAMIGVLLNLILGLSRVILAMGRKGDLPSFFGHVSEEGRAPRIAVISIGLIIISLTLIGRVEITWAFSAFTVLIYYSITNLAALRLAKENRLYPNGLAIGGLIGCLFLAFWVPAIVWLCGLGLIGIGLIWHALASNFWK